MMNDLKRNQRQDAQENAADYHTDMPVGEILRRGREHFGQSLEQVEANLRIRAIQLYALEQGDVDQLPGKAYALGFVRSYSEYLGLDGDKMVELYKNQTLGKIKPDLHFPVAASDSKLPTLWLAGGLSVLGVVLIGIWAFYNHNDTSEFERIPSVASVMAESDMFGPPQPTALQITQMQARKEQTQATNEFADNPASKGIILNIVENSWVEIRDATGKAIVSRVLKAGEQYFVPDRGDLSMSLGNASGVEIVIGGKALPVLGKRGEVRRNVSLDSESLKALAQKTE